MEGFPDVRLDQNSQMPDDLFVPEVHLFRPDVQDQRPGFVAVTLENADDDVSQTSYQSYDSSVSWARNQSEASCDSWETSQSQLSVASQLSDQWQRSFWRNYGTLGTPDGCSVQSDLTALETNQELTTTETGNNHKKRRHLCLWVTTIVILYLICVTAAVSLGVTTLFFIAVFYPFRLVYATLREVTLSVGYLLCSSVPCDQCQRRQEAIKTSFRSSNEDLHWFLEKCRKHLEHFFHCPGCDGLLFVVHPVAKFCVITSSVVLSGACAMVLGLVLSRGTISVAGVILALFGAITILYVAFYTLFVTLCFQFYIWVAVVALVSSRNSDRHSDGLDYPLDGIADLFCNIKVHTEKLFFALLELSDWNNFCGSYFRRLCLVFCYSLMALMFLLNGLSFAASVLAVVAIIVGVVITILVCILLGFMCYGCVKCCASCCGNLCESRKMFPFNKVSFVVKTTVPAYIWGSIRVSCVMGNRGVSRILVRGP